MRRACGEVRGGMVTVYLFVQMWDGSWHRLLGMYRKVDQL